MRTRLFIENARDAWRRWTTERIAGRESEFDRAPAGPPPGFLIGCGRSGVALAGEALGTHPDILALTSSFHAWAAVDRRTDVANRVGEVEGMFMMDARHASGRARVRFNRLFHRARARAGRPLLVEATLHNVGRIGFLDALAPGARFTNIVRNGSDVARSIDRLASREDAARPDRNPWWGSHDCKWAALARDGAGAGYFAEEVGPLESHLQRGAYEWLISLAEADRWRHKLGPRFTEITYPALTARPRETLALVCAHFGGSENPRWAAEAASTFAPGRANQGASLRLPPRMAAAFNAQQDRYGFAGRAEPC